MQTITHSELRNGSARVLRDAEAGQTMVVTNRGKPVAVLGPVPESPLEGPRVTRARKAATTAGLKPHRGSTPSQALLDEIRGDR